MKGDDIFYDREPWTLTFAFEDTSTDARLAPGEIRLVFRDKTGRAPVVYEYPASEEITQEGDVFVFTNSFTRAGRYDVFVMSTDGVRAVGSTQITIEPTPEI